MISPFTVSANPMETGNSISDKSVEEPVENYGKSKFTSSILPFLTLEKQPKLLSDPVLTNLPTTNLGDTEISTSIPDHPASPKSPKDSQNKPSKKPQTIGKSPTGTPTDLPLLPVLVGLFSEDTIPLVENNKSVEQLLNSLNMITLL